MQDMLGAIALMRPAQMTKQRFSKQLEELFDQALDLEGQARDAFIRSDNVPPELKTELHGLLTALADDCPLDHGIPLSIASEVLYSDLNDGQHVASGQHIGPYRLLRLLGEGGMANVWLADRDDGNFVQKVAIKCLKTGFITNESRQRFLREQQILAKMQHPHIARMYDAGVNADGVAYIVMEWVNEGMPVSIYCDKHYLNFMDRLQIFQKICGAVTYAHQNLIVHRDLKPGNILVGLDGEPKLLDFGIAKLLDEEAIDFTRTNLRLLTPEYAAPEQFSGKQITMATDVYALGAILYELLCGIRPHYFNRRHANAATHIATPLSEAMSRIGKAITEPSSPLHAKNLARQRATTLENLQRELRGDLEVIVMQALQEEPQRRYQTVTALSDDISRFLQHRPIVARKDTWSYRTRKFVQRNSIALSVTAMIFVLLLFAALISLQQAKIAKAQAEQAAAVKNFLTDLLEVSDAGLPRDKVPSTEQLLKDGASRIKNEFKGNPELKLELLLLLGRIHSNLSQYREARNLLHDAVALADKTFLPNNEQWLKTNTEWARLLQRQSNYQESYRHISMALAQHQKFGGAKDATSASALILQGQLLQLLDHLQDGVQKIQEALLILKQNKSAPETIILAQTALGFALTSARQLSEAEATLREASSLALREYGQEHTRYAASLVNLARNLTLKGELAEAKEIALKAIATYEKIFKQPNEQLIRGYYYLGVIYYNLNQYDDATLTLQKTIDLQKAIDISNEGGAIVASSMLHLAEIASREGRYEIAEAQFSKALPLIEKYNGPKSIEMARAHKTIAVHFRLQNNFERALSHLLQALSILQTPSNKDEIALGGTLLDLGYTEIFVNDSRNALAHLNQGLRIFQKQLPSEHNWITLTKIYKAMAHNTLNEHHEALMILDSISLQIEQSVNLTIDDRVHFWEERGIAMSKLGHPNEALASFIKAKDTLEKADPKIYAEWIGDQDREIEKLKKAK